MFVNRYKFRLVTWLLPLFALTAGLTVSAASAADFEPHSAQYDVRIKIFKGAMVTELQQGENGFTGTSHISPRGFARLASKGTIENRSEFRLTDAGVQPVAFDGEDSISKRKKKASLNFDWEGRRVTGLASQKRSGKRIETQVDAAVEDGMHDAV